MHLPVPPLLEVKGYGITFPEALAAPSGRVHHLVAVGVRRMTVLQFGLYSIGLYIEQPGIRALQGAASVLDAVRIVADRDFEWSLRIVPVRNGSMAHLRDALVRRLKLASQTVEHLDDVQQFNAIFPNSPMPLGSELCMSYERGAGLKVVREGQPLGQTASAWTCRSLLSIYTDPKTSTVPELVAQLQDTLGRL